MALAIGVDIGGTKISAGVVDSDGRLLARGELPSDIDDPEGICGQIADLVSQLGVEGAVGMGIGAAGLVDHETGHYLYGPNTGLRDLDLAAMVSEAIHMRVSVDNDANCAAWAEHRFGVGRGCLHFMCVTLGTGIGGGFVIDGKPYRGAHGGAGEIGHMMVDPQGPLCGCGRRGCWEQFASGLALERMGREVLGKDVRGPDITGAARDGDPDARRIVLRLARWVGWGLGSLVNLIEPEKIAIAGGIAREWDLMADAAHEAMVDRIESAERRPIPELLCAELGHDAGIIGAALLVLGS